MKVFHRKGREEKRKGPQRRAVRHFLARRAADLIFFAALCVPLRLRGEEMFSERKLGNG
jgi:hypothetical protein